MGCAFFVPVLHLRGMAYLRILLFFALVLLAGCSFFLTPTAAQRYETRQVAEALSGTWVLRQLGQKNYEVRGEEAVTLVFDAEKRAVSGYSGCNRFTGTYTLAGTDGLRFGPLAATKRACAASTETDLFAALAETRYLELQGNTLRLKGLAGVLAVFDRQGA